MRRLAFARAWAVVGGRAVIRFPPGRGRRKLAVLLRSRILWQVSCGRGNVVDHQMPPTRRAATLVEIKHRDDIALRTRGRALPGQCGGAILAGAAVAVEGVNLGYGTIGSEIGLVSVRVGESAAQGRKRARR